MCFHVPIYIVHDSPLYDGYKLTTFNTLGHPRCIVSKYKDKHGKGRRKGKIIRLFLCETVTSPQAYPTLELSTPPPTHTDLNIYRLHGPFQFIRVNA